MSSFSSFARWNLWFLVLGTSVSFAPLARADEFSLVPSGDPIYRQLGALEPLSGAKTRSTSGLTRYEAALQVARAIAFVSDDSTPTFTRSGWRALRDLTSALRVELTQLGIDVPATLALCARHLTVEKPLVEKALVAKPGRVSTPTRSAVLGSVTRTNSAAANAGNSILLADARQRALQSGRTLGDLELKIAGRLRAGAALLALERASQDPFAARSGVAAPVERRSLTNNNLTSTGSSAGLSLDFNSWLRMRAASTRRSNLALAAETSPALRNSMFAGAGAARGAVGGVDVELGALQFSTDVERLRTDTGASATRVGGGVGLSAWQNRLSMSAHLSRLKPDDRAALPATAAELNVSGRLSQRLSLSLLYQGLFTPQGANDASRLSGGLNLSF